MTLDDVTRMAREAGFDVYDTNGVIYATSECTAELERFAALVAAAEREACAQLCEKAATDAFWKQDAASAVAAAASIRARGGA